MTRVVSEGQYEQFFIERKSKIAERIVPIDNVNDVIRFLKYEINQLQSLNNVIVPKPNTLVKHCVSDKFKLIILEYSIVFEQNKIPTDMNRLTVRHISKLSLEQIEKINGIKPFHIKELKSMVKIAGLKFKGE